MSEEAQGVEEPPTIQLNPDMEYDDPELSALYKEQYPSSEDDTPEGGTPDSVESEDNKEEDPESKDDDPKEVKEPEVKKEEPKEELTPEELNAKATETLKEDLPETLHPYIEEYYKNDGKLSKDSLAKISEEHGFDESMVETFISTTADNYTLKAEAAKAKQEVESVKSEQEAEAVISELHEQVGGEEEWKAMVEWAATEAPKEVLNDYNELVEHPEVKVVRMAVKTLHSAYKDSQPQEPQYIKPNETAKPAPQHRPYRSDAEQQKDFTDPRYNVDMEWTNNVHERIAATMALQQ